MITVTPAAAEQVRKSAVSADCVGLPLRIAVSGGGCSGNQYMLGFDEQKTEDVKFDSNRIIVIVDSGALPMVKDLELDYTDDTQGSVFVFNNPNAPSHSHGGCGCSGSSGCE